MDSVKLRKRLKGAFLSVFPHVPEDVVEAANSTNTTAWDSMQTWNLLMVIQEEFSITIGLDQISKLNSFVAFEEYVSKKV